MILRQVNFIKEEKNLKDIKYETLKKFETVAAFEAVRQILDLPNISLIKATNGINYLPYVAPIDPTIHDYSLDYFTLVAIDDCYFCYRCGNSDNGKLSYSTDNGGTWSEFSVQSDENSIYVAAGNKILFKGQNFSAHDNSCGVYPTFYVDAGGEITSQQRFNVEGNIMSLLYGDNFIGETELIDYNSDNMIFTSLFYYVESLISAENLILPATELAKGCYSHMFQGCSSLTTAPVLCATTLAENCYYDMFNGCSSLNSITCLATNISAEECTSNWVYGVAQTGTFTKASDMTDWVAGDSGIPSEWTVQNAE